MPTLKQKQALDKIVGNGGNVTKAMREAGYSENTLNTPQRLTKSIGFKQLCKDRGLTEDFLVDALVEDIKEKPQNRKSELELGFKVVGRLSDRTESNKVLIINVSGETTQRYSIPTTQHSETSSS